MSGMAFGLGLRRNWHKVIYELLEGITQKIGLEKVHLGYKHVIIEGESGLLVHAGLLGYLKRRGRWRMDLSG